MSNKNGNKFMMKICKNHWWLAARAIISCERYATGQLADCKKPAQISPIHFVFLFLAFRGIHIDFFLRAPESGK